MLPVFQKRQAIGRNGFPFSLSDIEYSPGLYPVTESLHDDGVHLFEQCAWEISSKICDSLVEAVRKVYNQREALPRTS
ncbi:hypothetical protein OAS06_03195 [Gammaproteobacteria bacterium]|nr:hypothetical protein [Gammaproteobacteria bacterium]